MPVRYRSRTVKKETLAHRFAADPAPRTGRVRARRRLRRGLRPRRAGRARRHQRARRRHRRHPPQQGLPVSPLRRRDAAVSRSQLRLRRPQLRAAPRPERAEAGAARGGAARQPRQGRRRRGHAVDGLRPRDEPPPRRVLPAQDRQHRVVRLPDRGRMALAVPRHGPGARGASAVALLPVDPAAVRAHRVRAAKVARTLCPRRSPSPRRCPSLNGGASTIQRPLRVGFRRGRFRGRGRRGRSRARSLRSRWRRPPCDRSRPTTPSR